MLPKILIHSLKIQRKSFIFWTIGIVGLVILYMAIYPSIKESAEALNEYMQKLPEAFKQAFIGTEDYTSAIGYLSSEVYTQMLPILFLFYSIGTGSSAIAGEEDKGTLDIIISTPIRRSRVILEKFFSLVFGLLFLCVIVVVSLYIGTTVMDMNIALGNLIAITFSLFLLALNFGSLALLIGSLTGNKGVAIGLTTAVAILAFFVNALAPIADFLEGFQKFSPFYHYSANNPLRNGLDLGSVIFFICITVFLLILSIAVFEKRDLNV